MCIRDSPSAVYITISVAFADYDKIENFIQDAERHRRTPRLSAISGKMVDVWAAGFLRAVADSMRDAGRNWRRCHYSTIKNRQQFYCKTGDKIRQISCQNPQNIINMVPKICIKSMKNQGCVADVFLERFGAALGCQMLDFGSQNL